MIPPAGSSRLGVLMCLCQSCSCESTAFSKAFSSLYIDLYDLSPKKASWLPNTENDPNICSFSLPSTWECSLSVQAQDTTTRGPQLPTSSSELLPLERKKRIFPSWVRATLQRRAALPQTRTAAPQSQPRAPVAATALLGRGS